MSFYCDNVIVISELEKNSTSSSESNEDFAQLLEEYAGGISKSGDIVSGEVMKVDSSYVHIDINMKGVGRVLREEFALGNNGADASVAVGDIVEVYLERVDSKDGGPILSRGKLMREKAWDRLEKCAESGELVDGMIFSQAKGGFAVDMDGVIAFLPGSQVDITPMRDVTPLFNIVQPFKILKMNKNQGNIVVSRRAILEISRNEARKRLLDDMSENRILKGKVKNITNYGVFVDLGDVDGLLHVTDISWKRIHHPGEVLELGQEVEVKVIKFDRESGRISLGMKQLSPDPWDDVESQYVIGSTHNGCVTNIADYGAFVALDEGIEGLVHLSEMSWMKVSVHPRKILSEGDEVQVAVIDIDAKGHRMSLSMKQCNDNPWARFAEKYKVGDIVPGAINNIVDFGMFVGFDGSIDGLVYISDVSWEYERHSSLLENYKQGDSVKVKVLEIDVEKERIGLGIKQVLRDPLEDTMNNLQVGHSVQCVISDIKNGVVQAEIETGVIVYVKDYNAGIYKNLVIGDKVEARIVSMNPKERKIYITIMSRGET